MHRAQLRRGEIFVVMVLIVICESGVREDGERGQRKQQQKARKALHGDPQNGRDPDSSHGAGWGSNGRSAGVGSGASCLPSRLVIPTDGKEFGSLEERRYQHFFLAPFA